MENTVQIEIGSEDSISSAQLIANFFRGTFSQRVERRERRVTKAWDEISRILITIIGAWATERFILDPLADKVSEWRDALRVYLREYPVGRKIDITIKFADQQDGFGVQVSETSDLEFLEHVWSYVIKALNAAEGLKSRNINLSKIRMIPDGTKDFLILGYVRNRPTYMLDSNSKSFDLILGNSGGKAEDLSSEVWIIEQLIRRLDYLRAIRSAGKEISSDEISSALQEIEDKKRNLRSD